MPGTLNVWSNTNKAIVQGCVAPAFANLMFGFEYSVALVNTTDEAITSGTIEFEEADAKAENQCEPDTFAPMQPIAGCGPIVTGVPETGPVKYEITADRPIPPYGVCNVAAPCPKQFLQVTGVPAGVTAVVVITRPRRWDNTDPSLLYIPKPITGPFTAPFTAPAPSAPPHGAAAAPAGRGGGRAGRGASHAPSAPSAPPTPAE